MLYLLKTNKSPTCTDSSKYLSWESSSFSEDNKQETIQIKQNNQTNPLLKTWKWFFKKLSFWAHIGTIKSVNENVHGASTTKYFK